MRLCILTSPVCSLYSALCLVITKPRHGMRWRHFSVPFSDLVVFIFVAIQIGTFCWDLNLILSLLIFIQIQTCLSHILGRALKQGHEPAVTDRIYVCDVFDVEYLQGKAPKVGDNPLSKCCHRVLARESQRLVVLSPYSLRILKVKVPPIRHGTGLGKIEIVHVQWQDDHLAAGCEYAAGFG